MTLENPSHNSNVQQAEQQKVPYRVFRMHELMQEGQDFPSIDEVGRAISWSLEMIQNNEIPSSGVSEHFLALASKIEEYRGRLASKVTDNSVPADTMAPSLAYLDSAIQACKGHAGMAAILQNRPA